MKNVRKIDLGLTGYDELFANDEERKVNKLPRIFDIPISEIDDFPNHPFKVKIDEDMDEEHFKNFMNSVHLRQLYDTGVDAEYGDHLITLSTCEYTYTNGRFVVVAKKV